MEHLLPGFQTKLGVGKNTKIEYLSNSVCYQYDLGFQLVPLQ